MNSYDIVVIGGGPSGLMASVAAGERGAQVVLVDKGNQLGRKLAISGGGRCNVTNRLPEKELIRHIPGNGRFMYSPFSIFNNEDIIRFFEDLGIRLKEEDHGRMFPVSDKAKTVVQALINKVKKAGVEIRVNTPVQEVRWMDEHQWEIHLSHGEIIRSATVIIAVGGKSVPHTGSTGDGYAWAKKAGHHITPLFPTEVPLTSSEPFIRDKSLQGLSLRNIALSVLNSKGKKIITHEGDLLFTHFGLSGPTALRCSQFVVKEQAKQPEHKEVLLEINLFPELTENQVKEKVEQEWQQQPKKTIKNILKGLIPERLLPLLLKKAAIEEQTTMAHLPKAAYQQLIRLIQAFPVQIKGTLSIEEAFVTGGGVDLKEISPKTMQSKLKNGLYFCGEILDIHGYTGGYNITCALSTGYVAGKSAAEQLSST